MYVLEFNKCRIFKLYLIVNIVLTSKFSFFVNSFYKKQNKTTLHMSAAVLSVFYSRQMTVCTRLLLGHRSVLPTKPDTHTNPSTRLPQQKTSGEFPSHRNSPAGGANKAQALAEHELLRRTKEIQMSTRFQQSNKHRHYRYH